MLTIQVLSLAETEKLNYHCSKDLLSNMLGISGLVNKARRLLLTHFNRCSTSKPPENIRKPEVFWCFRVEEGGGGVEVRLEVEHLEQKLEQKFFTESNDFLYFLIF